MRKSRRVRNLLIAVLHIGMVACTTPAPELPVQQAQRVLQQAGIAYNQQDFTEYTRLMETAFELNPASLYTQYNLACAYALTGRLDESLLLLRNLTAARVDFGMANDPDLAALHETAEFRQLLAELEVALQPVNRATPYHRIPQLGIAPEGIAYDAGGKRFFFGSMRDGTVYSLEESGAWSQFASLARYGTYAALGMAVDEPRQLLWVVGTAFELVAGYDAETAPAPALFAFALDSGELQQQFVAGAGIEGFNDVLVMADGTVFVSGSDLHWLPSGASELEVFTTTPPLSSANGITADSAGERLYVATYPLGLGVIELESRQLHYIEREAGQTLYGIDGLYYDRGELLAVQNGVQPWRVLRLSLDADRRRLRELTLLEFNNGLMTPTTAAPVGDQLFVIGVAPDPALSPAHLPAAMRGNRGETVILKLDITRGSNQ